MILTRTPLRISFGGGGSDVPSFYRDHGCYVVSAAIQKYTWVAVHDLPNDQVRAKYSAYEVEGYASDIRHPIIRETLRVFGILTGVEIGSYADIPSHGNGLGGSSSFTVGLCHALRQRNALKATQRDSIKNAIRVELLELGDPIGVQDHYGCGFGGVKVISASPGPDAINVHRLECANTHLRKLENSLVLCPTGVQREAADVLRSQNSDLDTNFEKQKNLQAQMACARDIESAIQRGDLEEFAGLLSLSWRLKYTLNPGSSTPEVERLYNAAQIAGAIGGKLCGAGGGGYLLLCVPEERQPEFFAAMKPIACEKVRFDHAGVTTVFPNQQV